MAAVQFTNKSDVIKAFQMMDLPCWSVWCGKAMNYSCNERNVEEAAVELASYLDMMENAGRPICYTLCVYDRSDLKGDDRITNKTPYSASFNFQLTEVAPYGRGMAGIGGAGDLTVQQYIAARDTNKLLLDEVKAMRMELNALTTGEGAEDEIDDYGLGKIGKILQHPQIGGMAQQLVGSLVGLIGRIGPPGAAHGLAGVPTPNAPVQPKTETVVTDEQQDKIDTALDVLLNAYPDFADILVKLANMAMSQPDTMLMYVQMLRKM